MTCQNGVPWWYFHRLAGPYEGTTLDSVDPDRRQWEAIGPEQAIGCVVYPATEIAEPGVIRHVYGDKFALGEPDGTQSERSLALSAALEKGGFRAPVLDEVGAHRTSMLQDLEAGRAMEIDALVGAVQELGRIVHVPTPSIDIVLGLVKQLARTSGLYPTFPEQVSVLASPAHVHAA